MEHHHPMPTRGMTLPFDAYSGLGSPMLSKHLPFFVTEEVGDDPVRPLHEKGDFSIQLAQSQKCLLQSGDLIERRYAWRGYDSVSHGIVAPSVRQTTVQACRGKKVFGTLTLRPDSVAGLQADELYADEIDAIRCEGRMVCELTGLAIDPRQGSRKMLASLFHAAYIVGRSIHQVTDLFIEVNPRHVIYYDRLIGFVQAGSQRICDRVGAPAVLMRITFEYLDAQIAHHANHKITNRRSIYPDCLSKVEEHELRHRVLSMESPLHTDAKNGFDLSLATETIW